MLNSAGAGPQKLPKEWAKTWRDWKSNVLKKVGTYKSYAGGTGGGPPATLNTTPSEDDLLEFLTPVEFVRVLKASGILGVPKGGLIDSHLPDSQVNFAFGDRRPNFQDSSIRQSFEDSDNALSSIENLQDTPKRVNFTEPEQNSTKRKRSPDGDDTSTTKRKKTNVKQLFEQHTNDYCNIQERLLQVQMEKLVVAKQKLEFQQQAHKENMALFTMQIGKVDDHLTEIIRKVNHLTEIMESIAPQSLE